jgi:hypothetical protein
MFYFLKFLKCYSCNEMYDLVVLNEVESWRGKVRYVEVYLIH